MLGNSLKKIDLQSLQRPKTLIIIHYKNKRVSIPLFQCPENLSQFLISQLSKFEQAILHKDKKTTSKQHHKQQLNQIVCFIPKKTQNNQIIDLKMCLLLSSIRYLHNQKHNAHGMKTKRNQIFLDITSYYKFMEIQPYYQVKVNFMFPGYQLYTVLQANKNYTIYLGRRTSDCRFFSIKVYLCDNPLGNKQYNVMKLLQQQQINLTKDDQLEAIPEIQELKKVQGHLIFIYEFCPGGQALEYFRTNNYNKYKKIDQLQCLDYMKQLIWGVHTLHERYNLIHREICLQNIEIDLLGNIRIMNYANCLLCYSSNYLINTQIPQIYEGAYEMPNKLVPPEVIRSGRYNNLIDYYGVGTILYHLYHGNASNGNNCKVGQINQRTGIQVAIDNLMNDNIEDRQLFVNQIISELHDQKIKSFKQNSTNFTHSNMQKFENQQEKQPLALGKIYIGIPLYDYQIKNGIFPEKISKILGGHEDKDKDFFILNPKNKIKSKSKGKNKSKSKDSKTSNKSKSKDGKQIKTKKAIEGNFDTHSKKSEKSSKKSVDSHSNSVKSKKSIQSKKKTKNLFQDSEVKKTVFHTNNKPPVSNLKSLTKMTKIEQKRSYQTNLRKSPEKIQIPTITSNKNINPPFYQRNERANRPGER